jgi:hypothetical protein
MKTNIDAVAVLREALTEVSDCFEAARIEGLNDVLTDSSDIRLVDLVRRRLLFADYAACNALAATEQVAAPVDKLFASQYLDDGRYGLVSGDNEIIVGVSCGLSEDNAIRLAASWNACIEVKPKRTATVAKDGGEVLAWMWKRNLPMGGYSAQLCFTEGAAKQLAEDGANLPQPDIIIPLVAQSAPTTEASPDSLTAEKAGGLSEGMAGLQTYEFIVGGKSLRWYMKRDVDALLAQPTAADAGGLLTALQQIARLGREGSREGQVIRESLTEIAEKAIAGAVANHGGLSDAEFLSKRLGRVAKLAGVAMPDMTHEQTAEVAGTILGQIAAALVARPTAVMAGGLSHTDLSKRLREWGTTRAVAQHYADAMVAAADEIDRYYTGMVAWKQTAEKKDADWQAERMGRVDDRIANRATAMGAARLSDETILATARHIENGKRAEFEQQFKVDLWAVKSWLDNNGFAPLHIRPTASGAARLSRELVTLNYAQVAELMEAVTDGDNEAEVTLIEHAQPFKSLDGDDMAAGVYFYWTEYPEEGIVPLVTTDRQPANGAGGQS